MKKLVLTSAGFENPKIWEEFMKLTSKPASEIRVIFVPTASRTKEEKVYVEKSRKELLDNGVQMQNIKVLDLDHQISYSEVEDFDVIYVCGGNTFYLLHKVRGTGFDKIIKQFVEKGKVYVGVSAGSIIAGPDIEIASLGKENDYGVKDLTGLNLTKIAIAPHFCEEEFKDIERFKERVNYPVIPLKDNQALLILDNKTKIIGD